MKFFRNLFSRRRSEEPGDLEDWKANDQAECIWDEWYRNGDARFRFNGMKRGERHVVTGVVFARHSIDGEIQLLELRAFPGIKFRAAGFRKIRPQADEARAADAAFIETIRQPARELEEAA